MRFRRFCCALALLGAFFIVAIGSASAEANPAHACLVGVIVSTSAGPGFGQDTADLAQAGTLDPAGVAATYCH